jgi:trimeric autotransporter adhesin
LDCLGHFGTAVPTRPGGAPRAGLQPGALHDSLDLRGWNVQLDPQRGPVFSGAPAAPAASLAAVGDQWSSLGNRLQPINGIVRAIAVSGANVYLGGDFTDANGIPEADYIVKWDGTGWSALGGDGSGAGALGGSVWALVVSGGNLYAGGYFTSVNNYGTLRGTAKYIARWDGRNWSALGSDGSGDGVFRFVNFRVYAIAVVGTSLYVAGDFWNPVQNTVPIPAADYVARWDGTTWSSLGSNGAGDGSIGSTVFALAAANNLLYVGGTFSDVSNNGLVLPAADYLAVYAAGRIYIPLIRR